MVMIMLAIISLMLGGVAFFGMDDLETGFSELKSSEAMMAAESCGEEALLRIKRNASYTGGILSVGNATCTIAVTGTPCGTCTVNVSAVTGSYTRRLQSTVVKSGSLITISSWQEVD